eukprot:5700085-Amphidinium_carterae.1
MVMRSLQLLLRFRAELHSVHGIARGILLCLPRSVRHLQHAVTQSNNDTMMLTSPTSWQGIA